MKPFTRQKIPVADWLKVPESDPGKKLRRPVYQMSEKKLQEEISRIPSLSTHEVKIRKEIVRGMMRKETDIRTKARLLRLFKCYRNVLEIRNG